MTKLHFWGAAGTTTGSHHILEHDGTKIALDCGLFQGRRADFFKKNKEFIFPPSDVHALLLSHAHIDHCGNIPNFTKQGFEGDIVCTHATHDLARKMLMDSAHIQEKDTIYANRRRKRSKEEPLAPLYTMDDAEEALDQFVSIGYYRSFNPARGIVAKFIEAGHILGSAQIQIDCGDDPNTAHRVAFSGDIGRGRSSILRDPETPTEVDTLIMECTYGNRDSAPIENLRSELRDIVKRVSDRNGKVIIPAFAVGRTQDIVYHLNALFNTNELPRIPIFVDSPLATNVTEVFRQNPECFNRATRDLLRNDPDVFGFDTLTYTRDVEESIALNTFPGACVIISASGMCEHGRILHHLRNSVEDSKNLVLIVGYQAQHTLGRRIVERQEVVRIFGESHPLRAEVVVLNGFSAHADRSELQEYAFAVHARSGGRLKRIFLVHGDDEPRNALAEYLRESLGVEVITPARDDSFELA